MAATLKCDTIQNASSSTANLTLDASGNATVGNTLVMGSSFKRNRIINGDMRVDQRNAGASVTPSSNTFTLDRWKIDASQSSKFSVQQNAGSVTLPSGFTSYLGVTSLSSYTVGASEAFGFYQPIEGYNVADFGFGASGAKTLTLSFYVRSSLTGTFGGSIMNGAFNRSYPFSYSISSANTWTQITVSITGDTSGTWATNNTAGMEVYFSLGTGSTYSGTAGSWAGTFYASATGATSVVGTNGATFYITGVQLEVGSVATPYERQIYSEQLAQCLRYCYLYNGSSTYNGGGYARQPLLGNASNAALWFPSFPVQMRATPTLATSSFNGTTTEYYNYSTGAGLTYSSLTLQEGSVWAAQVQFNFTSGCSAGNIASFRWTGTPSAYIGFVAEL